MIVLYVILGIIGIGIVICIIGVTNAKKNQKNTSSTTVQDNLSNTLDKKSKIQDEISKLRDEVSKIRDSIDTSDCVDKRLQIGIKLEKEMSEIVKEYEGKVNLDPDFAELLNVCKEKVLLDKKDFIDAFEKCKEKNLVELQNLYIPYENMRKLERIYQSNYERKMEWFDVYFTGNPNHETRTTWTDPRCEEYSKKLLKLQEELVNLDNELSKDETYAKRKETISKWSDYMIRSIVVLDEIHGMKAYELGRKDDKIGIWDDNGDGKVISIDDVLYFQVKEESSTLTYSTGKPSKLGTAMNEAIWGTAAATASAINKMNQNTHSYTRLDKRAKIYFKFETGISPLEAITTGDVDKLMSMMPEKLR